ncbi:alternate-type signal peptide domain-containing protein [Arthrobacter sp. H14-L1]|uniref:alternate-type signal peptide domain-containing protein n=1 Tax=Arthrobacter sp. H14-L1 TaxID=2996697 RepID=UPI0022713087|nr:alternate-type signal peptide domain-containing protein [Arthrobacter sp. H14-L1]MCY0905695.1 alternate-type signal peptide domain-containing protein [Arthrobacter sp. H14-L1]
MNKMAKGAIATGVGVILLVGGGGTLATWNQAQTAAMGSVVSGDLNLEVNTATNIGKWTNAAGTVVDIKAYRVVPGDVLTYTQDLKVTLTGDLMAAKLAVTGTGANTSFLDKNVVVAPTTIKDGVKAIAADDVLTPSVNGHVVTASTTFTFKSSTDARDSAATKAYEFAGVGYKLVQQAPPAANAS